MNQPPHPKFRRLRIFTFDPIVDVGLDAIGVNEMVVQVPWEDLDMGPRGRYLEVMDKDGADSDTQIPAAEVVSAAQLNPSSSSSQSLRWHAHRIKAIAPVGRPTHVEIDLRWV